MTNPTPNPNQWRLWKVTILAGQQRSAYYVSAYTPTQAKSLGRKAWLKDCGYGSARKAPRPDLAVTLAPAPDLDPADVAELATTPSMGHPAGA